VKQATSWGRIAVLAGWSAFSVSSAGGASPLDDLRIFSDGYPRLLYFRNAEGHALSGAPAADLDAVANLHAGIVVKAFDEEKYGLSKRALDCFRAYKERNPRQLVLLHFNGGSRDPRSAPDFFAV